MPLTKTQLVKLATTLGKAEKSIIDVTADLRDAKRAGLDVTSQETELNIQRKLIRGIKNVYKPI